MSNSIANARPIIAKTQALHWLSRLTAHLKTAYSVAENAHNQRRLNDHHPDAAFQDAGLSRDDATSVGSHQNALPFFLQSGFAKR